MVNPLPERWEAAEAAIDRAGVEAIFPNNETADWHCPVAVHSLAASAGLAAAAAEASAYFVQLHSRPQQESLHASVRGKVGAARRLLGYAQLRRLQRLTKKAAMPAI